MRKNTVIQETIYQAIFTFSHQFYSVLGITDQVEQFMFYAVDNKIEKNKIATLTSPV